MPTQKYALEKEGPKRLEVTWERLGGETSVVLDGQPLGVVSKEELTEGRTFTLPDGSSLRVHFQKTGLLGQAGELHLTRDGEPVPGTAGDPETAARSAGYILYFLAGVNMCCGVIAMSGQVDVLDPGAAIGALVMAGIFGVLGLFTMRGSRIALGIAMALYLLDGVVTLFMQLGAGSPPVGMIFMRAAILMGLGRSFMAMQGKR